MLIYQGVIFDMDGVLCRTDLLHYRAWVRFTARHGIPFSEEIFRTTLGRGRAECMDIVLGDRAASYSPEEKERLILEKNEIFLSIAAGLTPGSAAPHVRETLAALRAKGLRLALGSSSQNAPFVIRQLDLGGFFDARVDGTQVLNAKPAPDIFLAAARKLGLPPSACLVVDDADAGVEAALAGGFDCAGIGPSRGDPRCRYHLADFSDLIRAVEGGS